MNLEGIQQAYCTTDFEFVAFALAYKNPVCKVERLYPLDNSGQNGRGKKFTFILVGRDDDSEFKSKMDTLFLSYINGDTVIEPTQLAKYRKTIRGYVKQQEGS